MLALLFSEVSLFSFLELKLRALNLHLVLLLLRASLFSFVELKLTALHLQSVLLLLRAYLFSSLDFFPATVVLALMIRAEVELDDFAGQVAVAAAVAVMMKPTLTRVALDLFVEVVSAKLFDPDSIPMLLQVLIRTHPTLGERWRAYVTQLVRGQRELNPLL